MKGTSRKSADKILEMKSQLLTLGFYPRELDTLKQSFWMIKDNLSLLVYFDGSWDLEIGKTEEASGNSFEGLLQYLQIGRF